MTVQRTPGNAPETPPPDPAPAPGETGSTADQHYPIDKVIFGVAAALVVAFIVWGIVSVDTLSAVATAVLGGLMTGGGWGFRAAARGVGGFAPWVGFRPVGQSPLGRGGAGPAV